MRNFLQTIFFQMVFSQKAKFTLLFMEKSYRMEQNWLATPHTHLLPPLPKEGTEKRSKGERLIYGLEKKTKTTLKIRIIVHTSIYNTNTEPNRH